MGLDTNDDAREIVRSFVGRRLGEYECLERLGSGGMADVYLARRRGVQGFRKLFAIKVVGERAANDLEFRRMFMREARIASTLDHPNVAQVVDFGRDGEDFYLVMEYVDGPTLLRLLKSQASRPLPLPVAVSITIGLCSALDYVHERVGPDGAPRRLVHRDVSPSNVLLTREGTVKLVDFGIAKPVGGPGDGTTTGVLKGKVGYMSPEQVRGEPLDRRSDIFSLGIVLYELTTGRRCFFSESMFEVLNKSQQAEYDPPSRWVDDYPAGLDAIVRQALARDTPDRFKTALRMQEALEDFALESKLRVANHVVAAFLREETPVDTVAIRRAAAAQPTQAVAGPEVASYDRPTDEAGGAEVSTAPGPDFDDVPAPRRSSMAWAGAGIAVAGVAGLAWVLASGGPESAAPVDAATDATAERVIESPAAPPPRAEPGLAPPPAEPLSAEADDAEPSAEQDAPAAPTPQTKPRKRRTRAKRGGRKKSNDRDALLPPSARR